MCVHNGLGHYCIFPIRALFFPFFLCFARTHTHALTRERAHAPKHACTNTRTNKYQEKIENIFKAHATDVTYVDADR
jgi:hypothetical protein